MAGRAHLISKGRFVSEVALSCLESLQILDAPGTVGGHPFIESACRSFSFARL